MENLKCSTCGYVAPSGFDLKAHIDYNHFQEAKSKLSSTTNSSQKQKCCVCDYFGSSDLDLEIHVGEVHLPAFLPSNDNPKESFNSEALIFEQSLKQKIATPSDALKKIPHQKAKGQKRQQEIKENNIKKKTKMECSICLKQYINGESLRSHIEKKHPEEENSPSFFQRLIKAEKKNKALTEDVGFLRNKLDLLENKVDFYTKIKRAEIAEKKAEVGDEKKANIIRASGFNWEGQENDKSLKLQDKIILNMQNIFKKIIPELKFSITKAQLYQPKKKVDVVDVSFSESSDVVEIFTKLKNHCNLKQHKNQKNVMRLLSPATRVRYHILETIGTQVQNKFQAKQWRVQYNHLKPYLYIAEKDKDKEKLDFSEALVQYNHLLKSRDLQEIKELCTSYGIKGNDLSQFVLKL
jgi:hypothetical protein